MHHRGARLPAQLGVVYRRGLEPGHPGVAAGGILGSGGGGSGGRSLLCNPFRSLSVVIMTPLFSVESTDNEREDDYPAGCKSTLVCVRRVGRLLQYFGFVASYEWPAVRLTNRKDYRICP